MPWDKKLKFEDIEKIFLEEIKHLSSEKELLEYKHKPAIKRVNLQLAYNSILLTQLKNGSRISEAVDGILKFKEDKKREQKIRARKRKKRITDKKTGEIKIVGRDVDRWIIIPTKVKFNFLDGLNGKTFEQVRGGACLFAFNHHKINTHSLRYAFISWAGRNGKPAQHISKMIRHTNIGQILSYIREDEADDMLREMVK